MAKQVSNRRIPFAAGLVVAAALCAPLPVNAGRSPVRTRAISVVSLQAKEQKIWRFPVHDSEFADVPHTTAKSRCENTQAPEALTTPNPLLDSVEPEVKIQVSFIVGTDGRVHSPLILQSAGSNDIRAVLDTVRSWRYRPAMCNGVPTETEGKIQFSGR
jgi:TonB family protein